MKNAIIVHGMPDKSECDDPNIPSSSNDHWFPWLQKQLIVRGIAAHTPEIPHPYNPNYDVWKHEFERYEITPETILVGHSCGGGFLIRWLSEHQSVKVGKVLLVAPWLDPDREATTDFFEFKIDAQLADRTERLTIFNSDNDFDSIHKSVQTLRGTIIGSEYREFHQYGHFCKEDLKSDEFPELLEALTK